MVVPAAYENERSRMGANSQEDNTVTDTEVMSLKEPTIRAGSVAERKARQTTSVGFLRPTWWKKRTNCCKMSSEPHLCVRVTPSPTK